MINASFNSPNAQIMSVDKDISQRGFTAKIFKLFWIMAIFLLYMNIGRFFGLGNLNPMEKGLFLISGILLLINSKTNKLSLIGTFIIVASILYFGSLTSFHDFSWMRVLMATLALLSLLIFFIASPNEQDRILILRTIVLATPLIIIYSLLLYATIGTPMYMIDHTGATRLGGTAGPAFLAAASYASSIASAQMYSFTRKKKYFLLVFFCIFVSFLSGSRMPSLVAAVSAFSVLFFAMRGSLSRITFTILGLTAVIAFLFIFGDQLINRIQSSSASGRNLLWNAALRWVDYYPWHGVGFGHHTLLLPAEVLQKTRTIAVHNEYIRLTAELGYIGAAFAFFGIFLTLFGAVIRNGIADTFITILVIGLFFLYSYSDNTLTLTYCLFGPLAYAIGSGLDRNKFI